MHLKNIFELTFEEYISAFITRAAIIVNFLFKCFFNFGTDDRNGQVLICRILISASRKS